MNKELSDVIKDARYSLIARLAVGSLWAPLLWLAVMALGDVPNFESEVGTRVQTLNGFGRRVNEPLSITSSTVISLKDLGRRVSRIGLSSIPQSVIAVGRTIKQQIRLTPYASYYSGHCQRRQLRLTP